MASPEDPVVEYDSYVPLTCTWPTYNRLLDPPKTLMFRGPASQLEIKLHPHTNELVETIVLSAVPRIRSGPLALAGNGETRYVPTFDPANLRQAGQTWSVEVPGLHCTVYPNCLEIAFADVVDHALVGAGRVSFGVMDDSRLTSVVVRWDASERSEFLGACGAADGPDPTF